MASKKIVVPARAVWFAVEQPEENRFKQDAEPEYHLTFMVDKAGKERLVKGVQEALFDGADIPKKMQLPIKEGESLNDEGERRYGEWADGQFIIRAASKFKPTAWVGKNKNPLETSDFKPYAGVGCMVSISPYTWKYANREGVSVSLAGVWFTKKLEKLPVGGSGDGFGDVDAEAVEFDDDLETDVAFDDDLPL